jgi:hypothetical protein
MKGSIVKIKNYFALAGIALWSFSINACAQPTGSTASTRSAPATPLSTPTSVANNIARAEAAASSGDPNAAGALVLAYGEATRDPQLARVTLTQLLNDYFRLRALATSAMQASQAVDEAALRFAIFQAAQNQVNVQQNQQLLAQQQRIVEQNQILISQNERMITLLDQIARKK